MRPSRNTLFLSGLLFFILAMNCECDQGSSGLKGAAPRVDKFHLGGDEQAPDLGSYGDTPTDGQLTIDFGLTDVDTINRRYLFLRNTGLNDLVLMDVSYGEDSSTDFYASCLSGGSFGDCPTTDADNLSITSGQDLVVQLNYAPRDLGTDSGTVILTSNAQDQQVITISMTGEGVTPEVQVCVTDCLGAESGADCMAGTEICNEQVDPQSLTLEFGDADMDSRITRNVTIRNQGDRPLQVSSLGFSSGDYNQFVLEAGNTGLPGELPAGQEVTFQVSYDPATGGVHSARLQILSNDVNERELKIVLNGRGIAPRVCPDPLALDFGNVPTGGSAEGSFTITNCGLLDLDLPTVALASGSSSDFAMVANPAPATVAPGDSVQVTVSYSPQSMGSDSGGVDIFSNDPASDPSTGHTGTISLLGTSMPKACQIQATPVAVTFGPVVQNEAEVINLVVSNQGTDTCTLNDVQISTNSANDEFSILQAPSPNTDFEPGDTLFVEVQYLPTNLGSDTGVLSLFGNDQDTNEVRVDLNGEGIEAAVCDLVLQPAAMQFGSTRLNTTRTIYLTAINQGQAPCEVRDVAVYNYAAMGFYSEFTLTGGGPGFTLNRRGQPNDRQEIEVTFAPTNAGQHVGQLWLHTDDDPDFTMPSAFCFGPGYNPAGPGDACINLTGLAAKSDIEVVPTELDFGVVTVGCNSPEMHVTVYNLGTIAMQVQDIYLEDPLDPNFEIRSAPSTPLTLQGGGDFQVRLRYHPQDTNVHRGALYIVSDATNDDMLIVPLFGRGTDISEQTDVFHQPSEVKSDVLFVIDNSGSMGEEQSALASNFDSFIQYATSLQVNFHVGVITTEVNASETGMGNPARDLVPGVLVQAPSRPKIITNNTPNISQAFADNVSVGTCCSDEQEAGLEAAWMALSQPLVDDPAANGGFLREDAKLYIVCVSDEQDQSRGDPDFYVDFFSSIKGARNPERMAVSAIVGDSPNGCSTAESGSRYIEVANRTGGIFESICTSNWAQALQNLGFDAFAAIREFPLSRPADSSTVTVTVNGSSVGGCSSQGCADGWTYYPDTNTIYFGDNVVPDMGDTIEVSYTALCL